MGCETMAALDVVIAEANVVVPSVLLASTIAGVVAEMEPIKVLVWFPLPDCMDTTPSEVPPMSWLCVKDVNVVVPGA